jgi:hypothetical protein
MEGAELGVRHTACRGEIYEAQREIKRRCEFSGNGYPLKRYLRHK